jgi:hypothetical protein
LTRDQLMLGDLQLHRGKVEHLPLGHPHLRGTCQPGTAPATRGWFMAYGPLLGHVPDLGVRRCTSHIQKLSRPVTPGKRALGHLRSSSRRRPGLCAESRMESSARPRCRGRQRARHAAATNHERGRAVPAG